MSGWTSSEATPLRSPLSPGVGVLSDGDLSYNAEPEEYVEVLKSKGSSNGATFFNLVNFLLGAGMLAVPQAFYLIGIATGAVVTGFLALLSAISSWFILKLADDAGGVSSYKEFACVVFGKPGAYIVDCSLILFLFGTMSGYMVVLADFVTPLYLYFDDDTVSGGGVEHKGDRAVVGLMFAFILFPLCLLPKIDFLKYTSSAALFCIIYLVAIIIFFTATSEVDWGTAPWFRGSMEVFAGLPVIVFAYAFHMTLFPVREEMENKQDLSTIVAVTSGIGGVCYTTVGLLGAATFQACTNPDVLLNYPNDSVVIIVAKVALIFVICFSYPLMQFPCRLALFSILFPPPPSSSTSTRGCLSCCMDTGKGGKRGVGECCGLGVGGGWEGRVSCVTYFCFTFVLVFGSLFVSLVVPNIQSIFGLIGATSGSLIMFVLPGGAAITLDLKAKRMGLSGLGKTKQYLGYFFLVFGLLVLAITTFANIYFWGADFQEDCDF